MIYAINIKTKIHTLYSNFDCIPHSLLTSNDYILSPADSCGWIKYDGSGECPVPDHHPVETNYKNGYRGVWSNAKRVDWFEPITEYRPQFESIKNPESTKEHNQNESWYGKTVPPVGTECEISTGDGWVRCTVCLVDSDEAGEFAIAHVKNKDKPFIKCDWSRAMGFRPLLSSKQRQLEVIEDTIRNAIHTEDEMSKLVESIYESGFRITQE